MRLAAFIATVLLLGASSAVAGEAEFGITQEFMTVCDINFKSYKDGEQAFLDNGWVETNEDMTEALDPGFFLNKVKDYTAYEVETEDGGTWYGTFSRGKLTSFKVLMCNIWMISDDITEVREDLEQVIERRSQDPIDVQGELRYLYAEDNDDEIYFVQEGPIEEGLYVLVMAKVYEGK